jgi:iron complex outermembrane receptor protein
MQIKIVSLLLLLSGVTAAQSQTDTLRLEEVTVSAYFNNYSFHRLPVAVALIDSTTLNSNSGQSLVPVFNSVAGVRMEERSPGSYRLSIRGSLLRSPFGIRNVKIYMDEFPLTNAGGDTYLNLLDFNAVTEIEILKGPDGSLFGANSGGVVRIGLFDPPVKNIRVTAKVSGGSFRLFHESVKVENQIGKNMFSIQESIQHCDGYRENSALERNYFQLTDSWNYNTNAAMRFLFFYADLNYQTPGGLTFQQWNENPREARPATSSLPGAAEQKAGVQNKTLYAGILHEVTIRKHLRHLFSLFGSHTDFKNPFITNYEMRNESSVGFRTWLEGKSNEDREVVFKANFGIESQVTQSEISNYANHSGNPDTLLANDRLSVIQGFVFGRLSIDFQKRFILETALSLNENHFTFSNDFPSGIAGSRQFQPQYMPKLAFSWVIQRWVIWRATISKGYSPPALSEIRSSDNVVNVNLEPEDGINYETGFRFTTNKSSLQIDISIFDYQLNHAIERRENSDGNEYFVNAGGTNQPGIEFQSHSHLIPPKPFRFIRSLTLNNASSLGRFVFRNYSDNAVDYSGNRLPGVPEFAVISNAEAELPFGFFVFILHNFTSRIPLNNANTDYAHSYHLVQLKIGWKYVAQKYNLEIDAGADNLLNEKYSLGNDLNAAGGRYYNAAPERNYYLSACLQFG